jgi:hypothetical protein
MSKEQIDVKAAFKPEGAEAKFLKDVSAFYEVSDAEAEDMLKKLTLTT